jgi:hypothetical protein
MFGIIKGFIDDLLAILFTGGILTFGVSEAYFLIKKEALTKIQNGQPSLSKFTQALTCQKFDDNMNLVNITSGHCKAKTSK